MVVLIAGLLLRDGALKNFSFEKIHTIYFQFPRNWWQPQSPIMWALLKDYQTSSSGLFYTFIL